MKEAKVTEHGRQRLKERAGLRGPAALRMAQRALERGLRHADCTGRLQRHLNALFLQHGKANNSRVYGEFVYLFANEVLITVLLLPHELRAAAKKARAE